jgi:hypothetical protein
LQVNFTTRTQTPEDNNDFNDSCRCSLCHISAVGIAERSNQ